MNDMQKRYEAFMESICTKYKCEDALPALREGFGALCESSWLDRNPDYFLNGDDADLTDAQEAAGVLKKFGGRLYVYDDATNRAFEITHISSLPEGCGIHFNSSEEKQLNTYIEAY